MLKSEWEHALSGLDGLTVGRIGDSAEVEDGLFCDFVEGSAEIYCDAGEAVVHDAKLIVPTVLDFRAALVRGRIEKRQAISNK